jgi:hypothetical protein
VVVTLVAVVPRGIGDGATVAIAQTPLV